MAVTKRLLFPLEIHILVDTRVKQDRSHVKRLHSLRPVGSAGNFPPSVGRKNQRRKLLQRDRCWRRREGEEGHQLGRWRVQGSGVGKVDKGSGEEG